MKTTAVCVVDSAGEVVREASLVTEPESLAAFPVGTDLVIERVGLEAGPLSSWLHDGLSALGFAVACVEAGHMRSALSAMRNKTDRGDARGIAQMLRTGWYRTVHVKSRQARELRLLVVNRRALVDRRRDVENTIRGTLKVFGLKVGEISRGGFEARVVWLLADRPGLLELVEPLLAVRRVLVAQYQVLHKKLLAVARADAACRRLMTAPGVGPVAAA